MQVPLGKPDWKVLPTQHWCGQQYLVQILEELLLMLVIQRVRMAHVDQCLTRLKCGEDNVVLALHKVAVVRYELAH